MRKLSLLLAWLIIPLSGIAQESDVTITGKVLDAESRLLLRYIQVDVIDPASEDTIASGIQTDSLGRFEAIVAVATSIEGQSVDQFAISDAYPNPASGGIVTIRYSSTPLAGPPELEVFDLLGRQVQKDALTASGIYLLRLKHEDGSSRATRFVKLGGSPVDFNLVRNETAPRRSEARAAESGGIGKSDQQVLNIVLSHPAYNSFTIEFDPATDLTDFDIELEPVFVSVSADEETYDVTYNPDAIILDASARSALIEADTVHQRYTFDNAALATAGITLINDRPLLIDGLALRRITGITDNGETTTIETEFATITDVVESGNVSWSHAARLDESAFRKATVAGKTGEFDSRSNTLNFSYSTGGYTIKIRFISAPSDTVRTEMTVQVTKKVDNRLAGTFVGTARLKDFESSGAFSIANSETETVSLENKNVRIEMDMSLAAAGSGLDDFNWKMPEIGIPIRFTVGPVPVTVNVKVQVVLKMSVINEASATASTKLAYSGTTGFEYNGVDVELKQQTIDHLLGSTTTDAASSIGNLVDANLGVAFPRVSVDMFAVPIVPSFLVGFVVGSGLRWGPVCKTGYVTAEVKAAVDLKFFSLTHTLAEAELWKERKDSPPC